MTQTPTSPKIQTSISTTDGRIALIDGDEELGYLTFRITPTGVALAEHTSFSLSTKARAMLGS